MRIQQLTVRNFMSFGDEEQTVWLDGAGLVLVEGVNRDEPMAESNGAGKSALAEAIVWGLTGKTLRGLKGDEVIRADAGQDCQVRLSGERGGKEWEIHRTRKMGGTTRRPSTSFYVDGAQQGALGDPDETQRRIDRFLGVTYDLLSNTMIFGQSEKWRFSELTDARRKELFDQILGTWRFGRALDWTKERHRAARDRLAVSESAVLRVEERIQDKTDALASLKALSEAQQAKEVEYFEGEIARVEGEVQTAQATVTKLDGVPVKVHSLKEQAKGLRQERDELGLQFNKWAQRRNELDYRSRETKRQLDELKVAFEVGDTCTACGSTIDAETEALHAADVRHRRKALTADRKKLKEKQDVASAECIECEAKIGGNSVREAALMSRIERLDGDLKKWQVACEVVRKLTRERTDLKASLKAVKARKPGAQVKAARAELKALKEELKELKDGQVGVQSEVDHLAFWVEGFGNSGVKSHYLDHVVPLMNKRARKYGKHLTRGTVIEFDTQKQLKNKQLRDKFDVMVNHQHGAGHYMGSSAGERRKVDIVVARVLQSLEASGAGMQPSMVWFDEVFESLDRKSCEAVLGFLREEAMQVRSVFVISHLDWLKPQFNRVLRVIKERGESRIEWS